MFWFTIYLRRFFSQATPSLGMVQSVRSKFEQKKKIPSDLHPLEHIYSSARVKHTPPANTSHVVLARFDQLNLLQ
jgi:hypothetical protein